MVFVVLALLAACANVRAFRIESLTNSSKLCVILEFDSLSIYASDTEEDLLWSTDNYDNCSTPTTAVLPEYET